MGCSGLRQCDKVYAVRSTNERSGLSIKDQDIRYMAL